LQLKLQDLPPLQRKIVICVSEGKSRSMIADELNIGYGTVRNYLTEINHKLSIDKKYRPNIQIARWVWEQENEKI